MLNISRRNLDRVLYFAQYIVTYVDEDARQKALKRLEDEISLSDRELGDMINLKIAEVKQNRDKVLKEHDAQREVIKENYDEQIGSKIDPVIKEGQRLESEIQTRMGKNIRKAIIFKALDKEVTIVDVGEEVTSGHLSEVQSIVKEMIVERLFLDADPAEMGDDENLMENYGIDSVNLFEIVVGLEEQFEISFEDEDFSVDLFANVNSLADFVERKRS